MTTKRLSLSLTLLGVGILIFYIRTAIRRSANADIAEGASQGFDPGAGVIVYGCLNVSLAIVGALFIIVGIIGLISVVLD